MCILYILNHVYCIYSYSCVLYIFLFMCILYILNHVYCIYSLTIVNEGLSLTIVNETTNYIKTVVFGKKIHAPLLNVVLH